jgi:hypothetical protein
MLLIICNSTKLRVKIESLNFGQKFIKNKSYRNIQLKHNLKELFLLII